MGGVAGENLNVAFPESLCELSGNIPFNPVEMGEPILVPLFPLTGKVGEVQFVARFEFLPIGRGAGARSLRYSENPALKRSCESCSSSTGVKPIVNAGRALRRAHSPTISRIGRYVSAAASNSHASPWGYEP